MLRSVGSPATPAVDVTSSKCPVPSLRSSASGPSRTTNDVGIAVVVDVGERGAVRPRDVDPSGVDSSTERSVASVDEQLDRLAESGDERSGQTVTVDVAPRGAVGELPAHRRGHAWWRPRHRSVTSSNRGISRSVGRTSMTALPRPLDRRSRRVPGTCRRRRPACRGHRERLRDRVAERDEDGRSVDADVVAVGGREPVLDRDADAPFAGVVHRHRQFDRLAEPVPEPTADRVRVKLGDPSASGVVSAPDEVVDGGVAVSAPVEHAATAPRTTATTMRASEGRSGWCVRAGSASVEVVGLAAVRLIIYDERARGPRVRCPTVARNFGVGMTIRMQHDGGATLRSTVDVRAPRAISFGGRTIPVVGPSIRDPRLHLALIIVSVIAIGTLLLDFRLSIPQIVVTVLVCAVVELVHRFVTTGMLVWPASGMQTATSTVLVLRVVGVDTATGCRSPGCTGWWASRCSGCSASTSSGPRPVTCSIRRTLRSSSRSWCSAPSGSSRSTTGGARSTGGWRSCTASSSSVVSRSAVGSACSRWRCRSGSRWRSVSASSLRSATR